MSYCQHRICDVLMRKHPKSKRMLGGSEKYIVSYKHEFVLTFNKAIDENETNLILLSNNLEEDINRDNSCIVIELYKNDKVAHLYGMSSSSIHNCFSDPEFILKKPSSFYLNMTIKMLKKYKEKFNINKITLQDNAMIKPKYGKNYNLSQFKLLTEGISWYEKYGFKINKEKKEQHKINKELIKKLKIKDLKVDNIILNVKHKKLPINYLNSIIKYIKDNKNEKLMVIMKEIFVYQKTNYTYLLYSLIIDDLLILLERKYPKLDNNGNRNKIYYERYKSASYYMKI